MKLPIKVPAIKVSQPLGDFFVVSLSAEFLLKTCYTIKAEILEDSDDSNSIAHFGKIVNSLVGNQRSRTPSRLKEIKRYTETVDASFPNSIILGANYDNDGHLITSAEQRWDVERVTDEFYYLVIPSLKKLASIIDGQHRVFGFEESNAKQTELVCSVYLDLPLAYHARIFTNINMNQRRVDKNLAYNLFQFDMEQGEPNSWSPETLAVYFTRVLASDSDSPLKGKIRLGTLNSNSSTTISMASIIDGILSLITNNPKNDRELLHSKSIKGGRDRSMLSSVSSKSPLRKLYLDEKDKTLYEIVMNYFSALIDILWKYDSFRKTLGIHASFDFLRELCETEPVEKLTKDYFNSVLSKSDYIDFNNDFFGVQTKLRTRMRNTLLIASGLRTIDDLPIKPSDRKKYDELI
ncbi:DGQHR domain-containing protein [Vibrio gigantis]|uniref:DGQHR domain-containing protein n=1 Tax=Vibrio gigantis TaxID=296199 RepID=UPI001EFB2432|nr:DGQHR domain-containing protein [Vibrio gigantis]ULN65564.1 DGQHR domain-containing protein [Vibrio gigantis]